jgi:hypothetical protein|tara:strand:- start:1470 stop:1709 length:240 start_codon:yes stop_codon:yes gene_type:complete
MDFTDRNLPLPFAAEIRALNGGVDTLGLLSRAPSLIDFEAQVGECGLVRIDGTLLPQAPEGERARVVLPLTVSVRKAGS